ncbi:DUF362 domain-containing protein [Patescibacteria group bacterium]
MGHINSKSYYKLQERLSKAPQGATESEFLVKILKEFLTEDEADLVSVLPLNLFSVEDALLLWKIDEGDALEILSNLSRKGILLDFTGSDARAFIVSPTITGFFEFAFMKSDGKFNHQVLSELFYQYIDVDDEYIKKVFNLNPSLARNFTNEEAISEKDQSAMLDYERATKVINDSSCVTVGNCYCRHKKEHLGESCDKPQRTCLTLNKAAESLSKHGVAEEITKKEALMILKDCKDLGLVQIGDNVQGNINWICNCCKCCCDALAAYRRLKYKPKISSNFFANTNNEKCVRCEICTKKCPVDAISVVGNGIKIDWNRCIGCGVCVNFCGKKNISLERKENINFTPKDTFERYILSAIDAGQLQNFIFDNYSIWTHEIMRDFLGILLNLKPSKLILANRQVQSVFLKTFIKTKRYELFDKIFNDGEKVDYSHPELKRIKS